MSRSTYVFARHGGLVVLAADRVTVMEPKSGWASTLTGELASDARTLLDSGELSARLSALGETHPGVRVLLELCKEQALEAGAKATVRLEGFGTLFVELLGRCNEKCTHCYASSGPEIQDALPREICESIVDDAAALGFSRIQFTGGDPLLCRFLPELVVRALDRGIPTREVYTNGLALTPSLLEALRPGKPCFAMSFYSHRPEVHEGITQTPGSHRRTSEAIQRALDSGLEVRVGIIAMDSNEADLAETISYVRDLGAEMIAVSPTFGVGRGAYFAPSAGIPQAMGNTHGAPAQRASSQGAPAAESGAVSRWRAEGKLCVTYEGRVVPCIFNRDMVLGNIYDRRLSAIAAEPDRQGRRLQSRDDFLRSCGTGLQCSSCKLTACALHFGGAAS